MLEFRLWVETNSVESAPFVAGFFTHMHKRALCRAPLLMFFFELNKEEGGVKTGKETINFLYVSVGRKDRTQFRPPRNCVIAGRGTNTQPNQAVINSTTEECYLLRGHEDVFMEILLIFYPYLFFFL